MYLVQEYEIRVPAYNDRFIYPLKADFRPSVVVTNTGDEDIVLGFRTFTDVPWPKNLNPQGIPTFPRGNTLYLSPSESTIVHVQVPTYYTAKDPSSLKNRELGEHSFSLGIEFFNVLDPLKVKKVLLNYRILVVDPNDLENTSVKGYVSDKKTGEPMTNVKVVLKGLGGYNPSSKTNSDGLYEIKCHGSVKYQIEVEAPGYGWDHRFIKPIVGGPLRVDLKLESLKGQVTYELSRKYNGNPGNLIGVMSGDSKYVIFGYRDSSKLYNTIYFFSINGELIWKKTMDSLRTTPGVNISDDGSYIVAANLGTPSEKGYVDPQILLFDKKGNLLWQMNAPGQCREVTISHNKKYLASQGGLDVYLHELETGKLIWRRLQEVRQE